MADLRQGPVFSGMYLNRNDGIMLNRYDLVLFKAAFKQRTTVLHNWNANYNDLERSTLRSECDGNSGVIPVLFDLFMSGRT